VTLNAQLGILGGGSGGKIRGDMGKRDGGEIKGVCIRFFFLFFPPFRVFVYKKRGVRGRHSIGGG